jgi:hypothetical protein
VRAETSLVNKRSWELVPCGERTSVDTGNLVVTKSITFVLAHEPLHTKEVQVPLIGVLRQRTELKTRVRLPAIAGAVAPPLGAVAANTTGGNVGTNVTLGKSIGDVVDVRLDLVITLVGMVVGAMLRCDGNLEECEESNQHGHHALGLAEVCHIAECNGAFVVNDRKSKSQKKKKATAMLKLRIRNGGC